MPASQPPSAGRFTVHRPARIHPRPALDTEIVVAAPPPAAQVGGAVAWLSWLVPLLGSAGSVGFLLAMPGPRHAWLLLAVAGAALASVGLGLCLRLLERRAARRARRRERVRYLAHLGRVAGAARRVAAAQLEVADRLHPDLPRLWALVNRGDRLWERRPGDADFLTVRVGRGRVPLAAPIRLDQTGGPLAEHDPELVAAAEALVERAAVLPAAPVTVSLSGHGVLALTGPSQRTRALARSILCEAAALHAPDDLRILVAFPPAALPAWDWLKWLPHSRDAGEADPAACLLAETTEQLAALLERVAAPRLRWPDGEARAYGAPPGSGLRRRSDREAPPYLLVVLDGVRPGSPAARLPMLGELLERAAVTRTAVLWLADDRAGEPSELGARVELDRHGTASLQETAPGGRRDGGLHADQAGLAFCEAIARRLAPLRLEEAAVPGRSGPQAGTRLLGLLGLDAAGLQAAERWRQQPRTALLRTPIGVGTGGEPVLLDLKEAAEGGMGPHGLVVGATGSGKSELLRTIVAGLAITHPPEQLGFVLVDFKGGAAFAELAGLPQVAGMITNLASDLLLVDRVRAALEGEQLRRQRLLREAGNLGDIRAYHAARAADPTIAPLPHLLVVVDEFGELLAARPDFLDLFVAIGRVGRSLGIHLLLASQRLDEGRIRGLDGHLRYRVCLRTFGPAESVAVLGTPDAYHLPAAPGWAWLKVDADAPTRFSTALVAARRCPPASRPPGNQPAVVSFTPTRPVRRREPMPPPPEPAAGQAGAATDLEAVVAAARGAGRPVHQVWLPPLEAEIPLERLDGAPGGWLRVPVGILDRPLQQAKEPLVLDFSGGAGHLAVVGAPRTGKSTLLCTIAAALASAHPPGAVHLYAIDLGGGLLHRLAGLPHVGAVCGAREPERARRLVRQLRGLVAERELAFRRHGIDSMAAWHRRRRADPGVDAYGEVFLLVDNWGQLRQELAELADELGELAVTGLHHGVHLVLSANRWADLRPGLRDNLGGRLELRLNDPVDSELSRSGQLGLPDLPGRGITPAGLQFQAALPGPVLQVLGRAMPGPGVAPPLRMLPELLREASLPRPGPGSPAAVPFAVDEDRLEPVWLDLFAGPPHLLVLGDGECGKTGLLRLLARGLAARHRPDRLRLLVIDPRRTLLDLADLPHLEGYATGGGAAVEAAERLRARLADRLAGSSWAPVHPGQRQVVLIDDYELLLSPLGGPLDPLLDLLGRGGELGLHVLLARSVAGTARTAFEPVYQRLCELGGPGLVMNGDPGEGPLLGGQKAARLPPGRGFLVRRRHPPTLVQVAHADAGSPRPTRATG